MKPSHPIRPAFDDRDLVPTVGLADSAGWDALLESVTVASPNDAANRRSGWRGSSTVPAWMTFVDVDDTVPEVHGLASAG